MGALANAYKELTKKAEFDPKKHRYGLVYFDTYTYDGGYGDRYSSSYPKANVVLFETEDALKAYIHERYISRIKSLDFLVFELKPMEYQLKVELERKNG